MKKEMHKINKIIIILYFIFIFIFFPVLLSSCSNKSEEKSGIQTEEMKSLGFAANSPVSDKRSVKDGSAETAQNSVNQDTASNNEVIEEARKKIYTANVDSTVNDLEQADRFIQEKVRVFDGYIENSGYSGNRLYFTVKIPAENFFEFLTSIKSFGSITNSSTNVQDVTDQYFDLEHRIETKKILLKRYQDYLKQAKNIDELLKIEYSINNLTYEIEALQGNFKHLQSLITYSTVTVNYSLPVGNSFQSSWPSFKLGFKKFVNSMVNFFYTLFFIVLYVIIYGIPIIIVAGVIYYIGFGKIGLIKKMFRFFSGDVKK